MLMVLAILVWGTASFAVGGLHLPHRSPGKLHNLVSSVKTASSSGTRIPMEWTHTGLYRSRAMSRGVSSSFSSPRCPRTLRISRSTHLPVRPF